MNDNHDLYTFITCADLPLSLVAARANVSEYLVGSYVSLQCQAQARPRPTFNWYHDGKQVIPGSRIKIFPQAISSNDTTVMVLAIASLIPSDAGSYHCQVIDDVHRRTVNSTVINLRKLYLTN